MPMTYAADLRAHLEVVVADLVRELQFLELCGRWPGGGEVGARWGRGGGEVEARWGGVGGEVGGWAGWVVGQGRRALRGEAVRGGWGRAVLGAVGCGEVWRGAVWRGAAAPWPLVAFFCFFCPFSLLKRHLS